MSKPYNDREALSKLTALTNEASMAAWLEAKRSQEMVFDSEYQESQFREIFLLAWVKCFSWLFRKMKDYKPEDGV